MSMPTTLEKPLTYKDYEALPEGAPYQLIDGELIMTPAPTPLHQNIIGNIYQSLRYFVESQKLGRVFLSPIDVKLTDVDVFQPDLVFIRKEHVANIRRDKLNVVPDLVVEVLSPSNAFYDLTHKKTIYAESGVEEYWVIDPKNETVEIFLRDGDRYRSEDFFKDQEILKSHMFPGFTMKLNDVFAF
jgi:Uma2 family endonuclease